MPMTILTSSSTPLDILAQIPTYQSALQTLETQLSSLDLTLLWEHVNLTSNPLGDFQPQSLDPDYTRVFFDLTFEASYSRYLGYKAASVDILQIVMGRHPEVGEIPGPNTLFLEPSPLDEAAIMAHLITYFSWRNIGILVTSDSYNQQSAAYFQSLITATGAEVLYSELITETKGLAKTREQIALTKITRAAVFALFTDPVTAAKIMLHADENSLGGSGFGWILSAQGMRNIAQLTKLSNADVNPALFGLVKTGLLGLVDTDLEGTDSSALFIGLATAVVQAYETGATSGKSIRAYCLSNPVLTGWGLNVHFTSAGFRQPFYVLRNMVSFALVDVAVWDWTTKVMKWSDRQVVWPGGGTQVPDDSVTVLTIGILVPDTSAAGSKTEIGKQIRAAVGLALGEVNKGELLGSDLLLSPMYLDTAESPSLAASNMNRIASSNILGFIGPLESALVLPYIQAIKSLPDPKPLVSYGATSINLTDTKAVQYFLRTIQPDNNEGLALAQFIKKNGWKSVGVVYTKDDYGIGLYSGFLSNIDGFGISVDNAEDKRAIFLDDTGSLKRETNATINTAVSELIRSQVRIVVYLGHWRSGAELLLRASRKQLTGELYIWLGAAWLSQEILSSLQRVYSPEDYQALLAAFEGCFAVRQLPPVGNIGQTFTSSFLSTYGEFPGIFAILAYDSVLLYARAIAAMITRGEDYHRGKSLLDALKTTQFPGASGILHFSGNDRTAYGYLILHFQAQQLAVVFSYDPISTTIFNSTGTAVQWAGDSPPADRFAAYSCPFPKHMVTISLPGVFIVIAVGAVLFILTLILSLLSYRKWKLIEIRPISPHTRKTWKDFMLQIGIIIEFFQLLALAPSLPVLQTVLEAVSNLAMLDPMRLLNLPSPVYWIQLSLISGLCDVWFLLVLLIMVNAERCLVSFPSVKRLLALVSDIYLPLVGNLLFFPFLSQLLDAIVCDHIVQGSPFVWRDCYMTCWSSQHAPYVAICLTAVVCYAPLAAYSQPMWQQADTDVNIMMRPLFLLCQTCTQVLLIAVGNSLRGTNEIAHGCVFTTLMTAYSVISVKVLPFNYQRCNLWEIVSLFSVTSYSFIATVSQAQAPTHVGWFIGLVVVWGLLGILAFGLQCRYFPSLFRPPDGVTGRHTVPEAMGRHLRQEAVVPVTETLNDEEPSPPDVTPCSEVSFSPI